MKVDLSERLTRTIESLVEKGEYESAEAVVEAAISLLEERDHLYWEGVNRQVADARAEIAAGRYRDVSDLHAFVSEIKGEVRRRQAGRELPPE